MSAPFLKILKVRHYKDEDKPALMNLIKSAKHLEQFESYKCRIPKMVFASNDLTYINLHRAECTWCSSVVFERKAREF